MGGWTAPTANAAAPSPDGCGSPIIGDHTSLHGLTPMTVLVNNAGGNHS
jgi:hypothetical protein